MVRRDARQWRTARTRDDLATLTAWWLSGRLDCQPGYYGPVDVDEDMAPGLTRALVEANRSGFLTHDSQAGIDLTTDDGSRCQQLAWVAGFASPAMASALQSAAEITEYRAIVWTEDSPPLAVTTVDGRPVTFDGWMTPADISTSLPRVRRRARADVLGSTQVSIVDPVPGRNTLWAWLVMVATQTVLVKETA